MDELLLPDVPVFESTALDPQGRGEEFGAAFAPGIAATIDTYRGLLATIGLDGEEFAAAGRSFGGWLSAEWPELSAELAAMAGAAGVPLQDLVAVNARTEVLAIGTRRAAWTQGVTECSALAGESPRHGAWFVQNWDWFPSHAASRVVWRIPLAEERGLATFTEVGILAKVGLNASGVGVGLNMLRSTSDGDAGVGLPVHVALRALLQTCRSWTEAEALLRGARFTASSCITVISADTSTARSVEVSPRGIGIVGPDPDRVVRHTNHFVTGVAEDLPPDPSMPPTTEPRLACLASAPAPEPGGSPSWAQEVLTGHEPGGHLCRHTAGDYGATLSQITLVPQEATMSFTSGPPCTTTRTQVSVPAPLAVNR